MTGSPAQGVTRLGIVGTGAMASEMARASAALSDVRVAAVLSRTNERARTFCDMHAQGAESCSDLAAFLERVDAIYVATPAAHHGHYVDAAIDAGKSVLCEKPLTGSTGETERLLAKARAQGVLVMEAIWTLALPAYRALKSQVEASGQAVLQFDFSYPLNAGEGSHYFDPEAGGVLLDRAVYGYAAAIDLLGDVAHQSAFVTRNTDGLDISAELRLEHASGARSFITLAFDRIGPNALHVSTARGLLSLGPSSLAAETLAHKPYPHVALAGDGLSRPGLKDRLKALPLLRRLRYRMPERRQVFSYGVSSYAPVLQAFLTARSQNRPESAIVPHTLSEEIARLTEAARQQK